MGQIETSGDDFPQQPEFVAPPAKIGPGPVHVWKFVTRDEGLLSAAETAAAGKFSDKIARAAFVAGRSGLRRAASVYTGRDPREFEISICASGKPFFENLDLHFNLSHSGEAVAAAFSGSPVGADIEIFGRCRNPDEIARRFFHPDEVAACADEREFLRLWTAKEAMLKLTGTGLSGGLAAARLFDGGRGEFGGRTIWVHHFLVGRRLGAVASFEAFEVKGWFQI